MDADSTRCHRVALGRGTGQAGEAARTCNQEGSDGGAAAVAETLEHVVRLKDGGIVSTAARSHSMHRGELPQPGSVVPACHTSTQTNPKLRHGPHLQNVSELPWQPRWIPAQLVHSIR